MSTIGSPNAAGLGLASSIVGSSRPEAVTDRTSAAAAEQKAIVDQNDVDANDVADAEFGSDRDADGRLLYRRPAGPHGAPALEVPANGEATPPRPADAFGDRGKTLDIEA